MKKTIWNTDLIGLTDKQEKRMKNKILKAHMDYMKGFELSELVDQIENNLLAGWEVNLDGLIETTGGINKPHWLWMETSLDY